MKRADIYIERNYQNTIQGGINAANGLNAVFMVESVMAVNRLSDDSGRRRKKDEELRKKQRQCGLFAEILDTQTNAMQKAPTQFRTIAYGKNGQLMSMLYQTREYHY